MILKWQPQPDITAYELAECMNVFAADRPGGSIEKGYNAISPAARRHWEVVDDKSTPLFVSQPIERPS